jgi:hypothetical protein
MDKKQIWQKEVRNIYEKIKKHKEKYNTTVNGITIFVFPNVFSLHILQIVHGMQKNYLK